MAIASSRKISGAVEIIHLMVFMPALSRRVVRMSIDWNPGELVEA
jgi:hypothetical protein